VCPFCESAAIVTSSSGELIEPTAVLPFQINRQEAEARIRTWLTHQRFRPGDLEVRAQISAPRGIFLPFWTFDLGGTMSWRAQVEERNGRTARWVPREGLHLVYHDDVLVPASRSVPEALCRQLFDYDTKPLLPYSPGLLTDHATEIYQVPLDSASVVARKHALDAGRAYEERNSLSGERVRNFVMNSAGLIVESYKLALLPLWMGGYRYKAETFQVAVNGQTGTIAGRVPRGRLQRALAGLFGDCW
jgi:hypothetical protein